MSGGRSEVLKFCLSLSLSLISCSFTESEHLFQTLKTLVFFFSKTEEIFFSVCKGIPALDKKLNKNSNCVLIRNPIQQPKRTHIKFLLVIPIDVLKLSGNPVIEQTGRHLSRSLVQPDCFVKVSLRTIPAWSRLWIVKF